MINWIMPLRDKLTKLLADAQTEQNPELLERIGARLQDALAADYGSAVIASGSAAMVTSTFAPSRLLSTRPLRRSH